MRRPDHSRKKPVVLVLTGYYLPGHRAGGPVRSISNVVERLGAEFDFRIVTPDRDVGVDEPYAGVKVDRWVPVGQAAVRYVSPAAAARGAVDDVVATTEHDVLYLNSFFHPTYTIRPLLRRWFGRRAGRTLVAPRGELGRGALELKGVKKQAFIGFSRVTRLYETVRWHATGASERDDIRRMFGTGADVFVAPNLGTPGFLAPRVTAWPHKPEGVARLVFASRIMRKKNLAFLISSLRYLRGEIRLDVVGPIEDAAYWAHCSELAKSLPSHVSFEYQGSVQPDDMPALLDRYDLFVLPTLNENFGHAIVEALSRGLPAVISDTTPWQDLDDAGAGAVVPLVSPERFAAAVQRFVDMAPETFERHRLAAKAYGVARIDDAGAVDATRHMLMTSAGAESRSGPCP